MNRMSFDHKVKKEALSFDDVLIEPAYSGIAPADAILETRLGMLHLKIPIFSSAMDTVTEHKMAAAIAKLGGIGILHRNMTPQEQAQQVMSVKSLTLEDGALACAALDESNRLLIGAAVGTGDEAIERAKLLIEVNVDVIVIDTAHGHSSMVLSTLERLSALNAKSTNKIDIVVGNSATSKAATDLINAGAKIIKVGIGPGSICTTRIMSGVGVPQLSAVMEVKEVCSKFGVSVIADGGIKNSGDIAKAIVAGGDAVMIGGLIAGTKEAPGDVIDRNGVMYKFYRGMGSESAMKAGSASRYFQDAKAKLVPQGVEGLVRYSGELKEVLFQYIGGLRAAMGYTGCKTILEMHKAHFVKITNAGMKESQPHSLASVNEECYAKNLNSKNNNSRV